MREDSRPALHALRFGNKSDQKQGYAMAGFSMSFVILLLLDFWMTPKMKASLGSSETATMLVLSFFPFHILCPPLSFL